jgi:hypothetical protein
MILKLNFGPVIGIQFRFSANVIYGQVRDFFLGTPGDLVMERPLGKKMV